MSIVLLDIDGVLNPLGNIDNHPAGDTFAGYTSDWISWRVSVYYHEPMLKEILDNDTRIIWMSTWEELSNEYCTLMGFNYLPYLTIEKPGYDSSIKFNTIMKFIKNNQQEKIVIIEDELYDNEVTYLNSLPHVFAIAPNSDYGYMQEEHEKVMSFLKRT